MPQLVLQPCSDGAPRRHYEDTVANPVAVSRFASLIDRQGLAGLDAYAVDGRVALWGLVPNRSEARYERMELGASVIFVGGGSAFFMGEVAYKLRNRALAHALWGSDSDGRTWELMYAIRNGREIDISRSRLNEALGYVPSAAIQGFTVKKGEVAARVIRLASQSAVPPHVKPKEDPESGSRPSGRGAPRLRGSGTLDIEGTLAATWVFQSNPKRWDLREFLEMENSGRYAVNQHRASIRAGDNIWFRLTGTTAGLYGLGRATTDPEPIANDFGDWTCGFEITHVITPPITREDIKAVPELHGSTALRGFQYTNAELQPEIASALTQRFGERIKPIDKVDRSTEADIISAVQPRRTGSKGQGFGLSSAQRQAIESRAVVVATEILEAGNWSVEDVGSHSSYDLHATRGEDVLLVEVKGSTGSAQTVILTKNEVRLHRESHPRTVLIVVSGIELGLDGQAWTGRGGQPVIIHPWIPEEPDLEPLTFRYSVPTSGATHLDVS